MKNRIPNNLKPKSVILDPFVHGKFKVLCKGKSMKIGALIEDLIKLYLNNPKQIQEKINELKENEINI